jgi:PAS domain S-box-containing protein
MTEAGDAKDRRPPTNAKASGRTHAESDAASFAVSGNTGGLSTESGGLHRFLVESVTDYAIFALDTSGHILSWNEGARRIKGYTADEIIGRHFSTFYPAEDIAAGKPKWELEIAVREGRYEEEGWRLRKDGTRFWANVVIMTLRDAAGTHVGFAKVTRDLTERRAAQMALRESEERFRLIVHSVRDYGIFMLDAEGRVASWNEGARRIKGYTEQEILGKHFSIFYPAEDLAWDKPKMELEVAVKEGRFEDEGWRLRKDGTRFWANVIITTLRNDAGDVVGFAKVTRDLTERRAAQEQALADARRITEAEVANKAKSQFLAAMSHELRTPLNAIGGYTDLMELGVAGLVSDQQKGYLSRIKGSQRHLLGIITDLLNYSRMEAGQVAYEQVPVPLHGVVETVFPLLEPQAAAKGVVLEHGDCAEGPVARADRTKTEQIVLNLLSNAVKFTAAQGKVTVACRVADAHVLIAVSDTGPGIPADKYEAVFEPFVQLGRTLTSPQEGTGLGLAISRDMARAMGGDILVESVVDEGSTFTLTLPRA